MHIFIEKIEIFFYLIFRLPSLGLNKACIFLEKMGISDFIFKSVEIFLNLRGFFAFFVAWQHECKSVQSFGEFWCQIRIKIKVFFFSNPPHQSIYEHSLKTQAYAASLQAQTLLQVACHNLHSYTRTSEGMSTMC